jgi:hypothetical protein
VRAGVIGRRPPMWALRSQCGLEQCARCRAAAAGDGPAASGATRIVRDYVDGWRLASALIAASRDRNYLGRVSEVRESNRLTLSRIIGPKSVKSARKSLGHGSFGYDHVESVAVRPKAVLIVGIPSRS